MVDEEGSPVAPKEREYPHHLSYSQVKSIITCGEQYRLERRFGLAGPPGWATVGGKGFHIATEYFDLAVGLRESPAKLDEVFSDMEIETAERVDTTLSSPRVDELLSGRFAGREADLVKMLALTEAVGGLEREALALAVGLAYEIPERDSEPTAAVRELWLYALQIAVHEDAIRALNYHPEYWDPTFWTASGRESKAWPGKENRDWWNHFAPRWFVNYMHWRQTSGWKTAVLADGRPAKELDVSGELAGMTIKAYLDSVELDPSWTPGLPTVVDVKGLDVRTPLATPTGWTTMGEVRPGDFVLGANGHPVRVTVKSEVKQMRCYRVKFDDGTDVICDEEHLWETTTGDPRKKVTSVKGVQEIAARLRGGAGGRGQRDQRVRMPDPIEFPEADLPIDPYVLGVWIGDGRATSGIYTKDDGNIANLIRARGGVVHERPSANRTTDWRIEGLTTLLRESHLLGDKHVPAMYMRASAEQRADLIRGLMDTDGTWNKKRNQAVFSSVDKALATQVRELLLLAGERPAQFAVDTHGFGKDVTDHRVSWTPRNFNPFLSPVKASRVQMAGSKAKSHRRLIVEVEEVPSTPTVCIAVDAEDHLFLAGEQMVPTHNTSVRPVVDPEQLGFYATMLEILGYPRPTSGRYYNARIGELSRPYGLGKYSLEYFVWKYGNAKDKRDKGLLEANTSSPFCKSCKVRAYCYAVPSQEGYLSHLIPRPWEGALERLQLQAA